MVELNRAGMVSAAEPPAVGDCPPHYPAHLAERWHLPDGTPTVIRPIRPSDLTIESAFAAGLSAKSSYRRLLSSRQLQADELWRFANIDYDRQLALVVVGQIDGTQRQLAVARYVRDARNEDAEFAIVVGDAWQGCGLGVKLMHSLIGAARQAGVGRLSDVTLSTNLPMLALARKLGFTLRREPGDSTITRLSMLL